MSWIMRFLSSDIVIPFRVWGPRNSSHNGRKSKGITPECFDVRPLPCPHNPPRPLPPSRGEAASSNRRDGGFVILGVESDSLQTVGLGEEADLWLDFDAVSEQVNQYAS